MTEKESAEKRNDLRGVKFITEDLSERILSGELPPRRRLPGVRELAKSYGVSAVTVCKSIGELKRRGLIEAYRGIGLFAAEPGREEKKRYQRTHADFHVGLIHQNKSGSHVTGDIHSAWYIDHLMDDWITCAIQRCEEFGFRYTLFDCFPEGRDPCDAYLCSTTVMKWETVAEMTRKPILFLSSRPPENFSIPENWIAPDLYAMSRIVVSRLIDRGYRRIACLCGIDTAAYQSRIQAYRDVLEAAGLPFRKEQVFRSDSSEWEIRKQIEKLLSLPKELLPDAVYCISDRRAILLQDRLRELKIKVPAEMAIMGFDGCEEARRRGISTITIPAGDIGSWGVYFLNGLRTGTLHSPFHFLFCGELFPGKTC